MAGLRGRLMVWLLVPLLIIMGVSSWLDYTAAGSAAVQQDQNLQRLAPLLVSSVVAAPTQPAEPPVVLLAPPIEDFIKDRNGLAVWGIATLDGRMLIGSSWLARPMPTTSEPEFHSEQEGGRLWRILAQRAETPAGDYVILLADGSDAKQSWLRSVLLKVLLPNVLLMLAVATAVYWGVGRALTPLRRLTRDVTSRSSADLSALPLEDTPGEVRPLVQSLNGLFERLRDQHDAQRRFVADAAHQLRTPLAGLQSQVEAWAQRLPSPTHSDLSLKTANAVVDIKKFAINIEADELLRLRDATRRTSVLATQLLALSRADAQALHSQPMQRIDIRQLCTDVLSAHLDTATQLGVDLGAELDEGDALTALGHEWLLRELLMNLTDNAIRYSSEAFQSGRPGIAQVTLVAKHQPLGAGLELSVRDNGSGIPMEERSKVLERFYRLPGTRSPGNGLGLAIAQEIAQLHGSALRLQDTLPNAPAGQRGLSASLVLRA
jgi:two-component system, OmpR family, sensor histidine kinase TctE